MNMNEKLKIVYDEELNKQYLQEIFTKEELEKISAPHLLNIDEAYMSSKIKILYVGKETNLWWGKLKHYIDINESAEILKQRYRAQFFGGDVPSSVDIKVPKPYKVKSYGNPFLTEYKKLSDSIDGKTGEIVWANLLKMDLDRGKGYSKNSKGNKSIVEISKRIFRRELEILEPDYIVFATSYTYDSVIKDFFGDKITNSEVIETKSLWKFNIGNTICYRTWHPSVIKYKAKKNKLEYYKDIISDIKLTAN